jgi:hypothetical protein
MAGNKKRSITMAEQYYANPRLPIGNRNVQVKYAAVSQDKSDLRNYFQNYSLDPDTAW